jgi:acetoin utilization deacetylase AcuC-like enzyme
MGEMMTALFTHPDCLEHDTGPGHPECSDRLRAILQALAVDEFSELDWREAPLAEDETLLRVHSRRHLDMVRAAMPVKGWSALDPDTILSVGSMRAALRAAGAMAAAVDLVMAGEAQNAFCAVRPPGHHACPTGAMGFCLFNNIAIGALQARAVHGLRRIAVVDFDVHHGNGTQDAFACDADLFFASTHQGGAYPGTGWGSEKGVADNILNLPLRAGSGSQIWRQAMSEVLLPRLSEFAPELILISAGFDAHQADPLAQLNLHSEDFQWGTEEIGKIAALCCGGRVVSTLEGGYDLPALAASAAAHVRALMASAAVE